MSIYTFHNFCTLTCNPYLCIYNCISKIPLHRYTKLRSLLILTLFPRFILYSICLRVYYMVIHLSDRKIYSDIRIATWPNEKELRNIATKQYKSDYIFISRRCLSLASSYKKLWLLTRLNYKGVFYYD